MRRVLLAVMLALFATSHARADAMRCGSKLISEEDSIDKVLEFCGEPSDRSRTYIVRQPRYELNGNEYVFPGEEDVPVDTYWYDFGPNKLMRKLRFVAGRLESIETLGYGTPR